MHFSYAKIMSNLDPLFTRKLHDNSSSLGTIIKRYRDLNTVNGIAVNFTAETRISTVELKLGNTIITEDNIILSGNTL